MNAALETIQAAPIRWGFDEKESTRLGDWLEKLVATDKGVANTIDNIAGSSCLAYNSCSSDSKFCGGSVLFSIVKWCIGRC